MHNVNTAPGGGVSENAPFRRDIVLVSHDIPQMESLLVVEWSARQTVNPAVQGRVPLQPLDEFVSQSSRVQLVRTCIYCKYRCKWLRY